MGTWFSDPVLAAEAQAPAPVLLWTPDRSSARSRPSGRVAQTAQAPVALSVGSREAFGVLSFSQTGPTRPSGFSRAGFAQKRYGEFIEETLSSAINRAGNLLPVLTTATCV